MSNIEREVMDSEKTPEEQFDMLTDIITRPPGNFLDDLFGAGSKSLVMAVLRLHRPMGYEYQGKVCEGCKAEDNSTAPEWKNCKTIKLLQTHLVPSYLKNTEG